MPRQTRVLAEKLSYAAGTEVTAFFPEDGCKIHVLLYGLGREQFSRVMGLRNDIYALRNYIREMNLFWA